MNGLGKFLFAALLIGIVFYALAMQQGAKQVTGAVDNAASAAVEIVK